MSSVTSQSGVSRRSRGAGDRRRREDTSWSSSVKRARGYHAPVADPAADPPCGTRRRDAASVPMPVRGGLRAEVGCGRPDRVPASTRS